jgi:hypothetical protein
MYGSLNVTASGTGVAACVLASLMLIRTACTAPAAYRDDGSQQQ